MLGHIIFREYTEYNNLSSLGHFIINNELCCNTMLQMVVVPIYKSTSFSK